MENLEQASANQHSVDVVLRGAKYTNLLDTPDLRRKLLELVSASEDPDVFIEMRPSLKCAQPITPCLWIGIDDDPKAIVDIAYDALFTPAEGRSYGLLGGPRDKNKVKPGYWEAVAFRADDSWMILFPGVVVRPQHWKDFIEITLAAQKLEPKISWLLPGSLTVDGMLFPATRRARIATRPDVIFSDRVHSSIEGFRLHHDLLQPHGVAAIALRGAYRSTYRKPETALPEVMNTRMADKQGGAAPKTPKWIIDLNLYINSLPRAPHIDPVNFDRAEAFSEERFDEMLRLLQTGGMDALLRREPGEFDYIAWLRGCMAVTVVQGHLGYIKLKANGTVVHDGAGAHSRLPLFIGMERPVKQEALLAYPGLLRKYNEIKRLPYGLWSSPALPEDEADTFNGFSGFRIRHEHAALDPCRAIFQERAHELPALEFLLWYFHQVLCNGYTCVFARALFQASNLLLRAGKGWRHPSILVFLGAHGALKSSFWDSFFIRQIVGAPHGKIYNPNNTQNSFSDPGVLVALHEEEAPGILGANIKANTSQEVREVREIYKANIKEYGYQTFIFCLNYESLPKLNLDCQDRRLVMTDTNKLFCASQQDRLAEDLWKSYKAHLGTATVGAANKDTDVQQVTAAVKVIENLVLCHDAPFINQLRSLFHDLTHNESNGLAGLFTRFLLQYCTEAELRKWLPEYVHTPQRAAFTRTKLNGPLQLWRQMLFSGCNNQRRGPEPCPPAWKTRVDLGDFQDHWRSKAPGSQFATLDVGWLSEFGLDLDNTTNEVIFMDKDAHLRELEQRLAGNASQRHLWDFGTSLWDANGVFDLNRVLRSVAVNPARVVQPQPRYDSVGARDAYENLLSVCPIVGTMWTYEQRTRVGEVTALRNGWRV